MLLDRHVLYDLIYFDIPRLYLARVNIAPPASLFGCTFIRLPEWGRSSGVEIQKPISFAISIGFVQSSKSASGIDFRLDGVSMVVGRTPITDKVSKYSLSLRRRRAFCRLERVVTALPVVSPSV